MPSSSRHPRRLSSTTHSKSCSVPSFLTRSQVSVSIRSIKPPASRSSRTHDSPHLEQSVCKPPPPAGRISFAGVMTMHLTSTAVLRENSTEAKTVALLKPYPRQRSSKVLSPSTLGTEASLSKGRNFPQTLGSEYHRQQESRKTASQSKNVAWNLHRKLTTPMISSEQIGQDSILTSGRFRTHELLLRHRQCRHSARFATLYIGAKGVWERDVLCVLPSAKSHLYCSVLYFACLMFVKHRFCIKPWFGLYANRMCRAIAI